MVKVTGSWTLRREKVSRKGCNYRKQVFSNKTFGFVHFTPMFFLKNSFAEIEKL